MQDRIKKILEYLEPNGIGGYQDISSILNEYFPLADRHDTSEVHSKIREPQDFFRGLLEAKYIKARDTEIRGLGTGNSSGGYTWFSDMKVEVSIASEGLGALSLERARNTTDKTEKSVLTTNASIERLNGIMIEEVPKQTIAMRRTAIYAFAAVLIALSALLKDLWQSDKRQLRELKTIDKLLQTQTKGIDTLNKSLRQIDTTLKTLKDDSTMANTKTATPNTDDK